VRVIKVCFRNTAGSTRFSRVFNATESYATLSLLGIGKLTLQIGYELLRIG
jgi:hypothetical protein